MAALLAHRYAVVRDRRKERNEAIVPLRRRLIEAGVSALQTPIEFDQVEIDAVRTCMRGTQLAKFEDALRAVKNAPRGPDVWPSVASGSRYAPIQDEAAFRRDMHRLLELIEPK